MMAAAGDIRILLVEDHPEVAGAVAALLCDRGVNVDIVQHGQAIEPIVERSGPNLVILDLGLPGEDGRAVYRLIRVRWRDLPVILCSAERPDVRDLLAEAHTAFLPKPFDGDTVMATIHRMLGLG